MASRLTLLLVVLAPLGLTACGDPTNYGFQATLRCLQNRPEYTWAGSARARDRSAGLNLYITSVPRRQLRRLPEMGVLFAPRFHHVPGSTAVGLQFFRDRDRAKSAREQLLRPYRGRDLAIQLFEQDRYRLRRNVLVLWDEAGATSPNRFHPLIYGCLR